MLQRSLKMKMIAKVILVPKPNSFQFDDRILQLEEPVKVQMTKPTLRRFEKDK
jgi:hypothetical protein